MVVGREDAVLDVERPCRDPVENVPIVCNEQQRFRESFAQGVFEPLDRIDVEVLVGSSSMASEGDPTSTRARATPAPSGVSGPVRMRPSVLFQEPLRPTNPTRDSLSIVRSTRASTRPAP